MKVWLASLFLCALVVKNSEVSGLASLAASGCGLQDLLSSMGVGGEEEGLHGELKYQRQVQAFPGNRTMCQRREGLGTQEVCTIWQGRKKPQGVP